MGLGRLKVGLGNEMGQGQGEGRKRMKDKYLLDPKRKTTKGENVFFFSNGID